MFNLNYTSSLYLHNVSILSIPSPLECPTWGRSLAPGRTRTAGPRRAWPGGRYRSPSSTATSPPDWSYHSPCRPNILTWGGIIFLIGSKYFSGMNSNIFFSSPYLLLTLHLIPLSTLHLPVTWSGRARLMKGGSSEWSHCQSSIIQPTPCHCWVLSLHCCNIAKVEQLKRTVLMAVTSCMTMHCNGANFGNCINGGMLLNQTPFKLWNSSLNQA